MTSPTRIPAVAGLAFSLAMTLCLLPAAPALAAEGYAVRIVEKSPKVQYFQDFTYDVATVSGPSESKAKKLTKRIRQFTMPEIDYYTTPDAETRAYLKKARPASFSSITTAVDGCRDGYLCVSQGSVFATPILAGSITFVQARAWSTSSTKRARLNEFVAPSQLPAFTREVKRKIKRQDCYYGFPIDLSADYASFPNWVPVEGGITLWFPEYEFGCQIMTFTVRWP